MKSSNEPSSSIGIRFVIPTGRGCDADADEDDDDERDASMLNSASCSRVLLRSLEDSVESEITIVGGRPCASKLGGGCGCGGGGGGGGGGAGGPPPVNVPEYGGTYGNTGSLRCIVGASRNNGPDPDPGPPLVPAIERRPAPTSSTKLSTKLMLEFVLLMLESEPCPRNNDTNPNGRPPDPSVPPNPAPAVGRDEDDPG